MAVTRYQKNFHDTFPHSNTGVQMLLAASTALPFTVPGTANQIYRAKFSSSYTAEVWVGYNITATVPTTNTATATTNQEFLPKYDEARYVKGGDVLSFISTGTPQVGLVLYQVQDIT